MHAFCFLILPVLTPIEAAKERVFAVVLVLSLLLLYISLILLVLIILLLLLLLLDSSVSFFLVAATARVAPAVAAIVVVVLLFLFRLQGCTAKQGLLLVIVISPTEHHTVRLLLHAEGRVTRPAF